MRKVLIAVASAAVLTIGVTGMVAFAEEPAEQPGTSAAGPTADELREAVSGCETQLSDGSYSQDNGGTADIPVCETGGAVHWKADFDVDCDGQRTDECNEQTDPYFQPETAFQQSDGQHLNSATLPHVVVPLPSGLWDYTTAGIGGGTVAAVTYEDKVVYAVVGDLGPKTIIGEGSYALAAALGIDPDPSTGGISGKVVDYILFPGVTASPIEDHDVATELGEESANQLISGCGRYGFDAYPDLAAGDEGAEVSAAQCLLSDAGFPIGDGGAPSGVFDEETVAATKQFQASVELAESDTIDSHTWTALLAVGETPTLQDGSSGPDVSRLQRALTAALGSPVAQDGIFGPKTAQAVEDYQTAAELPVDGVANAETWQALQKGV